MEALSALSGLETPLIITAVAVFGALRGTDVYAAMLRGAAQGLRTVARIFPALLCLLTAVYMLRASGALDALTGLLEPAFRVLGIPPETAPLVLLRPISGSGALAFASELMEALGPDSLIARTAAVMLGSTETTFYVISVYFSAAGVKNTRWAVPAALCADLAGFCAAAFFTRILW